MGIRSHIFKALSILALALFYSCVSINAIENSLDSQTWGISFKNKKAPTLKCEVARSLKKQGKGLMYRRVLKKNHCMIFVYSYNKPMTFWMKNTYIPLSIAFVTDDLIIVNIENMKPLNKEVIYSKRKSRYALEVNQGWFTKFNIKAGDKVVIQK